MAQLFEYGLFLEDMFGPRGDGAGPDRVAVLLGTAAGRIYEPLLRECWERWRTTPKSLASPGLAFAEELKGADATWDWLSFGLKRIGEVMASAPSDLVSAEAREAGRVLAEVVVPSLSVRNESYTKTAARAPELRAQVETHAAALGHITVPGPTAGAAVPISDWAERRVAAAQTIATLLSQRAGAATPPSADEVVAAFTLRSTIEGYVNRARASLADELRADPRKAREIDHAIFGLLDQTLASGEAPKAKATVEPPVPVEAVPVN
jgi:hypothetical protein